MAMQGFYERIDKLLKENSVTQKDLSAYIGLTTSQIFSNWKQRNSVPSAETAVKIAAFLNTTVEYLVTGEDRNPLAAENAALKEKIHKAFEILK